MSARRIRHLTTTWAFVFALLLKGAVPMLASAAAALQGKSVADVCSVYGVALPQPTGSAPGTPAHHADHADHAAHLAHLSHGEHASHAAPMHGGEPEPADHDGRHVGGDHCVLTALGAFAGGAVAVEAARLAAAGEAVASSAVDPGPASTGAEARWRARLLHAPPAVS